MDDKKGNVCKRVGRFVYSKNKVSVWLVTSVGNR